MSGASLRTVRSRATIAAAAVVAGFLQLSCTAREQEPAFERPPDSTYEVSTVQLQDGETTAEVRAARVTEEFFKVIGRPPWLGRTFLPREFTADAEPVVMLSHRLWDQRFGGTPEIIGAALRLDGRDHTVLGVMPPGIEWPPDVGLWIPAISQAP